MSTFAGELRRLAGSAGDLVVLADRADGTVIRVGDAVAKAHAEDTDAAALAHRVRTAAHPALAGILLPPLPPGGVTRLHDGRPATLWPYGAPVDPDAVPWEAAGTLLARLHAVPPAALGIALPDGGGPARAARALARLRATATDPAHAAARSAVERILAAAPRAPRRTALCHGDFHLGQLVRHPAAGGSWHLIDVDDLGVGDPAWDLARPAAWYAAGLLAPEDWRRLLGAYQAAAGLTGHDPWPELDVPARVLTAQSAALALVRAAATGRAPSEEDEALLISCLRIAALP
ncbi:phosphotransferase family protein [Streptomyces litchfieldiae]|uniref:Aminoglycoside phosphotransferase family protein n=1 Tax=Streptomyces litchfieldiae TaxID=3075543 RepID=A0ABU2MLI9_9ACTN|nr:aminoglycoside phosphotransferase family protein [Streptomyces sp. DSM 44938]MDT0342238.1 aminoglycoside phosphotransferase family protein [Streptomyces sp. DSM 44938]